VNLADAAYTLQLGRHAFEHRRAVAVRDVNDAVSALESSRVVSGTARPDPPPVAFLFPGQGSQYVGMGRGLYDAEPGFRAELDRCADLLRPHLGLDIRAV